MLLTQKSLKQEFNEMIYSQISGIIACIEKAIEINQHILLQSRNAFAVEKAANLSEILTDLQVYVVSIQEQYISLLNQKIMLEKELTNLDNCGMDC